jgi:hypothetical protein
MPALACPKCSNLREHLPPKTPGWCPLCGRWQLLREPKFAVFPSGRYRHLACVECHLGAWCRDFWSRPNATRCAEDGHVEAFDAHTVMGEFKPKDPRR